MVAEESWPLCEGVHGCDALASEILTMHRILVKYSWNEETQKLGLLRPPPDFGFLSQPYLIHITVESYQEESKS